MWKHSHFPEGLPAPLRLNCEQDEAAATSCVRSINTCQIECLLTRLRPCYLHSSPAGNRCWLPWCACLQMMGLELQEWKGGKNHDNMVWGSISLSKSFLCAFDKDRGHGAVCQNCIEPGCCSNVSLNKPWLGADLNGWIKVWTDQSLFLSLFLFSFRWAKATEKKNVQEAHKSKNRNLLMGTPGLAFFTRSYCITYSQMQQYCLIWVLLVPAGDLRGFEASLIFLTLNRPLQSNTRTCASIQYTANYKSQPKLQAAMTQALAKR